MRKRILAKTKERPSVAQEQILRALEEQGPLPDYFNRATSNALVRHAWVERFDEWEGRYAVARNMLRITTRGRWSLRRLDARKAS